MKDLDDRNQDLDYLYYPYFSRSMVVMGKKGMVAASRSCPGYNEYH